MKKQTVHWLIALGMTAALSTTALGQTTMDEPGGGATSNATDTTPPPSVPTPPRTGSPVPNAPVVPPATTAAPPQTTAAPAPPAVPAQTNTTTTQTTTTSTAGPSNATRTTVGTQRQTTTSTAPAPNTKTPLGASTYTGDQATLGNQGRLPPNADPTITRAPLGSSSYTRDVNGTTGYSDPFQSRTNALQSTSNGRDAFNNRSPNGLAPSGAFFPTLPRANTTIRPNSGYGIPNGSRSFHMDARGIQRAD